MRDRSTEEALRNPEGHFLYPLSLSGRFGKLVALVLSNRAKKQNRVDQGQLPSAVCVGASRGGLGAEEQQGPSPAPSDSAREFVRVAAAAVGNDTATSVATSTFTYTI